MAKDRKIEEEEDACPIPPGVELPKKSGLGSLTNMVLQVDWRVVLPVFSLGLILTVYGLLIPLPQLFIQPKDPETWNQPFSQSPIRYRYSPSWVPSYSRQVVHVGNLVLNGSTVFVIENCTYIVNGSIRVSDSASLVLRNAELVVPIDFTTWPAYIAFTNSSRLNSFNSSIVTYPLFPGIVLTDESGAEIRDSNFTVSIIGWGEAHLYIERSDVYSLDLAIKASAIIKESMIELFNNGGFFEPPYTYLKSLYSRYSWTDTNAQIYNSTIASLTLRTLGSSINVIGNVGGWHTSWDPSNFIQGGRFSNVTLRDSDVKSFSLITENSKVGIKNNSDIFGLDMHGGSLTFANNSIGGIGLNSTKFEISDSVIGAFDPNDESIGTVARTLMDYLYIDGFNGTLRFEQCRTTIVWIMGTRGEILGGLQITNITFPWDTPWISKPPLMLKRGYDVLAEAEGKAAEGVELTLRDAQSEKVWKGKTDASGWATFNITYFHTWKLPNYIWVQNATSTLTLTAKIGETEQSQNVTLVSTTPIVFSFEEAPEHPVWADKTTIMLSGSVIMIGAVGLAAIRRRKKLNNFILFNAISAEERGVKLSEEDKRLSPTKLASKIFAKCSRMINV